jgi:hypothetical protein
LYATNADYTTKFDAAISAGVARSAERAEFSAEEYQFQFPA